MDYSGIYSDGKSAAAHDVIVRLLDDRLIISLPNGEILEEWPFREITSNQPIRPGDKVQISSKRSSDANLFVPYPGFSKIILSHAPQLSTRSERWRVLYPVLAITFLIMGSFIYVWFINPNVLRNVATWIPHEQRIHFGKGIVSALSAKKKKCVNKDGLASLRKIQDHLENSTAEKKRFNISVAKLGFINAFAAPGEQILVSGELIEAANSPEEIAAVISHEMGHGIKLHAEAGLIRALGLQAVVTLLLGGDSGNLLDISATLLELNNRRSSEREADRIALRIMKNAQISPKPLVEFYERIQKIHSKKWNKNKSLNREDQDDVVGNLLSTHPSTPERIKLVASQPDWPTKPLLTDAEWIALKAICK